MSANQPEKTIEAIYRRCDLSNNGTENPMTFDEFQAALSAMVAEALGKKFTAEEITEAGYEASVYMQVINTHIDKQYQRAAKMGFNLNKEDK